MRTGTKEGRVISRRNLQRLQAIRDALIEILQSAGPLPDGSGFFVAEIGDKAKQQVRLKRGQDGLRLAVLVTSNAYRDRDGEIVLERALRAWVNKQWEGGEYKGDNVLLFWHDGPPIGDILYSTMHGPFLVEVAKERRTPYARAIFDMIEREKAIEWGVSQGFRYRPRDKRAGVYRRIKKIESSILPRSVAANAYTYAGVKMNNKDRLNFLKKRAPEALDLTERLGKSVTGLAKRLDDAGVERKEAKSAEPVVEKAGDVNALVDNLEAMIAELLAEAGAEAPEGLRDRIAGLVEEAITLEVEMAEDEEAYEDEAEDKAQRKAREGQLVELLESLVSDREAVEELLAEVKALKPVAELPAQLLSLEKRLALVEKRLKGGPRAASKSLRSEVGEASDLAKTIKRQTNTERLAQVFPDMFGN
jgi:hypothetical protein